LGTTALYLVVLIQDIKLLNKVRQKTRESQVFFEKQIQFRHKLDKGLVRIENWILVFNMWCMLNFEENTIKL